MHFSEGAVMMLSNGAWIAQSIGAKHCGTEHLLNALDSILDNGLTFKVLTMCGVDETTLRSVLSVPHTAVTSFPPSDAGWSEESLGDDAKIAIALAKMEAQDSGCETVGVHHLVFGILCTNGKGKDILESYKIKAATFKKAIRQLTSVPLMEHMNTQIDKEESSKRHKIAGAVLSRDCLVFAYDHDGKPTVRYAIPNEIGRENVSCWQFLPETGHRMFKLAKMSEIRRVVERAF